MTSDFPLVSICLPVYNGAQFLEGAIASILNTTYPHLEVIVSDDNSTDNSVELIKQANLPNLKLFTHPRYGLAENWNYCLLQARGEYIKFLFQDDLLDPTCIEKMVTVAETDDNIGLVFTPRHLLSETTLNPKHFPTTLHTGWSNLQFIQTGLLLLADANLFNHPHNKIGEPTCTLIRKSVFQTVGNFDSDFHQYLDLEMWYRIMSYYDIAFINHPLVSFQIHANQQTQLNLATTQLEIYQVWKKLLNHPDYDRVPLEIRQKLKRLFWQRISIDILKKIIKLQINPAKSMLNNVLMKSDLSHKS